MRLLKLYKSILESLDVRADNVGLLTHTRPDGQVEQINVSIDGQSKRLAMPNPELLRKGMPDELVAFHPLSEISNRGESEVLRKLKLLVNLRLTTVLTMMLDDLAELAADKERRKALPPKLLTLLEAMPHADQKLVDNITHLIGAALSGGKNRLISIYLSRGGKYMGEKHARVATVSFPILAELDDPDRKVYGVQLRAKDIPQIKALFDWILPNSDQVGTYNACSDSMDAPYFEALMRAYVKVARQLNSIQRIASKYLSESQLMKTDVDWITELDEMEQMRHEIPPLDGNKGIAMGGKGAEAEQETAANPGLTALQSRVGAAEPVRTSGPPTEPPLVIRKEVVDANDGSSIRSDLTSEELRRQNDRNVIRPITNAFATTPQHESKPVTSGHRRMSDLIGGRMQPPMNMGPMNMGGYVQPQYQQPVYNTGWSNGGMGYNQRPDPFVQVNLMASNMQQQQNGGWGQGWSNPNRF